MFFKKSIINIIRKMRENRTLIMEEQEATKNK